MESASVRKAEVVNGNEDGGGLSGKVRGSGSGLSLQRFSQNLLPDVLCGSARFGWDASLFPLHRLPTTAQSFLERTLDWAQKLMSASAVQKICILAHWALLSPVHLLGSLVHYTD
jgi:hypothetical protein